MTENENKTLPRRKFLKYGLGSLGGVLGISYLGTIGRFLAPPVAGSDPLMQVGSTSDFAPQSPKLVAYKGGGVEQGVYVINMGDGSWLALDFHCTHLQCAVNWLDATKSFACPCHGGIYDIRGNVKGGPPPRSLHKRVIQIQGDSVMIGGRLD